MTIDGATRSLERALVGIVDQLRAMPEVERIILYGSYAAGRAVLFTDLDLVVVLRSELPIAQRIADLYRRLDLGGVDVDLFAYTPEEIERDDGPPRLYRQAIQTGRVLFER